MKSIIIVTIIIFIFFIPYKIRIKYNNKVDVDLYIFKPLNIKIDVDKLLKKMSRDKNKNINISLFIKKLLVLLKGKPIIKKVLKQMIVRKISINLYLSDELLLSFVTYNNILLTIKRYLLVFFKSVNNENYDVIFTSINKTKVNIDLLLKVRLINLIIVVIISIKELISLIKYRKEMINDGTSDM